MVTHLIYFTFGFRGASSQRPHHSYYGDAPSGPLSCMTTRQLAEVHYAPRQPKKELVTRFKALPIGSGVVLYVAGMDLPPLRSALVSVDTSMSRDVGYPCP